MSTPPNNFGPGVPTSQATLMDIAVNQMQTDVDLYALAMSNPSIIGPYNALYDSGKAPAKIHNFTGYNALGVHGIKTVPVTTAPHPVVTGQLSIQQINAINSGQNPSSVITPSHAGLILPSTPQANKPTAPAWMAVAAAYPPVQIQTDIHGVAPTPTTVVNPSPGGQNTNTGSASANPYSVSNVSGSGTQYPVAAVNAGVTSLLSVFGSNPVVLIGIATALFLMFSGSDSRR